MRTRAYTKGIKECAHLRTPTGVHIMSGLGKGSISEHATDIESCMAEDPHATKHATETDRKGKSPMGRIVVQPVYTPEEAWYNGLCAAELELIRQFLARLGWSMAKHFDPDLLATLCTKFSLTIAQAYEVVVREERCMTGDVERAILLAKEQAKQAERRAARKEQLTDTILAARFDYAALRVSTRDSTVVEHATESDYVIRRLMAELDMTAPQAEACTRSLKTATTDQTDAVPARPAETSVVRCIKCRTSTEPCCARIEHQWYLNLPEDEVERLRDFVLQQQSAMAGGGYVGGDLLLDLIAKFAIAPDHAAEVILQMGEYILPVVNNGAAALPVVKRRFPGSATNPQTYAIATLGCITNRLPRDVGAGVDLGACTPAQDMNVARNCLTDETGEYAVFAEEGGRRGASLADMPLASILRDDEQERNAVYWRAMRDAPAAAPSSADSSASSDSCPSP